MRVEVAHKIQRGKKEFLFTRLGTLTRNGKGWTIKFDEPMDHTPGDVHTFSVPQEIK